MTANVFGTPIYIKSEDSQIDKTTEKSNSMIGKLKDVLKAIQPLEKAGDSIDNALKSLDGTGYDAIKNALEQIKKQIADQQQDVLMNITGETRPVEQTNSAEKATPPKTQNVPTADQIAGRSSMSFEDMLIDDIK